MVKKYWGSGLDKFLDETKSNLNLMQENLQIKNKRVKFLLNTLNTNQVTFSFYKNFLKKKKDFIDYNSFITNDSDKIRFIFKKRVNFLKKKSLFTNSIIKSPLNKNFFIVNNYVNQEESFNNVKNQMGKRNSVYLVKKPINKIFSKEHTFKKDFFFKLRFNDENSTLNHKTSTKPNYFCFKQKRYKIRKKISTEIFKHKYKTVRKKPIKF
jgi:hypothetical protein